ncbi:hypothetical protein ACQPW1_10345 [Nocardia sp. CA-128927]|uniref:hypothetical protein n=1 Tax=Nocardia sp. CA-128927 TaxID=3239975 RepID=UPI003D993536
MPLPTPTDTAPESDGSLCQGSTTTAIDDQGDYGELRSIDGTSTDGKTFHIHTYEDGSGGLVVSIYADPDVAIEIAVDSDSAPIAFTE